MVICSTRLSLQRSAPSSLRYNHCRTSSKQDDTQQCQPCNICTGNCQCNNDQGGRGRLTTATAGCVNNVRAQLSILWSGQRDVYNALSIRNCRTQCRLDSLSVQDERDRFPGVKTGYCSFERATWSYLVWVEGQGRRTRLGFLGTRLFRLPLGPHPRVA